MSESDVMHTYPNNDAREHVTDGTPCWCNPRYERLRTNDDYVFAVKVLHVASDWRCLSDPTANHYLHGAN